MTQPPLTDAEIIAVELEMREAQALREKKAANERAGKLMVFRDSLLGIGIPPGDDHRPGVLQLALRHFVKHCEAHMGRLMGPAYRLEGALYNPPSDRTFTPANAARQRRAALDALFVLSPADRETHIKRDFEEAQAHHKLVTAHLKRCTHKNIVTGESTWHGWVYEPAGPGVPGVRGERCTECGAFRPCQHRYVAFGVTFNEGDRNGQATQRCADCGEERPTPPGTATEQAHRDFEMRLRGEWPVAYRPGDGAVFLAADLAQPSTDTAAIVSMNDRGEVIDVVRIENLGQDSSNADPAEPPLTGKAPPAD